LFVSLFVTGKLGYGVSTRTHDTYSESVKFRKWIGAYDSFALTVSREVPL